MDRSRIDPLVVTNTALVLAVLVHGADHMRQERGVEALATEVTAGGTVVAALALASLVLAIRRHPRAALVSAVVGLWITAGVTAAHFAPHWSAFSDPYSGLGLDALSWIAAGAEVVAALATGVLGVAALRRHGGGRLAPSG